MKITEDDLPAALSRPADSSEQVVFSLKKGEPAGLPFSLTRKARLSSGNPSRSPLNLAGV